MAESRFVLHSMIMPEPRSMNGAFNSTHMVSVSSRAWNALIRTHHITSRKKVARLRHAAAAQNVYALIRCGKAPGIMYCEGDQKGVENWVASVQRLRYKDFQLAIKPAEMEPSNSALSGSTLTTGLHEVESISDFANQMDSRGILEWWRKGMGYGGDHDRL